MTDYLIIGNGVAGTTAAQHIREGDKTGKITILTEEEIPFYYRLRLNEFISGDIKEEDLIAKKAQWYNDLDIDLRVKTRIIKADPMKKVAITNDNMEIAYDRLLMATGSRSFIPPIKGAETKGVFSLRDIKDARTMIEYVKSIEKTVIIGGGLLGLETGKALRNLGKKVTVIEFFPRLLPRQLDDEGAKRLQTIMEDMGFRFRLGAKTEEIESDGHVVSVSLEDGEKIPAEMVVISAGVRPNMDLAESLGLDHDKGIKVNDRLQTSQPDIYAAGDVAEYKGMPYGIWPAAMEQGKIAGINIAGGDDVYKGTTMANTLKVVGIDLASAGDIDAEGKQESRIFIDKNVYRKIVLQDNQIIGCIMLGDTKGFNRITKSMSENKDVTSLKDDILEPGFDFKRL